MRPTFWKSAALLLVVLVSWPPAAPTQPRSLGRPPSRPRSWSSSWLPSHCTRTRWWRRNGGFLRLEPGMTKNGEGRAFQIAPALRALLERRQEYTRRCERAQTRIIPLVFHRKGQPVKSFRRTWAEACKKTGLPGLLFHDLRRSAVRNLERAGVSPSVAMKLVGHKTESVYRRDRGGERSARSGREAECTW